MACLRYCATEAEQKAASESPGIASALTSRNWWMGFDVFGRKNGSQKKEHKNNRPQMTTSTYDLENPSRKNSDYSWKSRPILSEAEKLFSSRSIRDQSDSVGTISTRPMWEWNWSWASPASSEPLAVTAAEMLAGYGQLHKLVPHETSRAFDSVSVIVWHISCVSAF